MGTPALEIREAEEQRVVRFAQRPITFEEFLELTGKDDLELIDGVMVEKMSVQLEHEKLFAWLYHLSGLYVEERNLGIVLGSRTAVEISMFRGRLPDLLFVRRERMGIVQQKAIYGAPDLVIELISSNDRPSDISALETDYRAIGVPEIVFIDQQKRRVRLLRSREAGYEEETLTGGTLRFESLEGFALQVEWLFQEPRTNLRATLERLLADAPDPA
jgi:Uma2 family endonuclease